MTDNYTPDEARQNQQQQAKKAALIATYLDRGHDIKAATRLANQALAANDQN